MNMHCHKVKNLKFSVVSKEGLLMGVGVLRFKSIFYLLLQFGYVFIIILLAGVLLGIGSLFSYFLFGIVIFAFFYLISNFTMKRRIKKNGIRIDSESMTRSVGGGYTGSQIFDMVTSVCTASKKPIPRNIYVLKDSSLNAFTFGGGKGAWLVIHEGLLRGLREDEVSAVIAHEMGHVKHWDSRFMLILIAIPFIIGIIGRSLLWGGAFGSYGTRSRRGGGTAILMLIGVVLLISTFFLQLISLAFSRSREYLADIHGARVAGHEAMSNALLRISSGIQVNDLAAHQSSKMADTLLISPRYLSHGREGTYWASFDIDRSGNLSAEELRNAASRTKRVSDGITSTHPAIHNRILNIAKNVLNL
jgi:Zn-dependent protease with chaperone function